MLLSPPCVRAASAESKFLAASEIVRSLNPDADLGLNRSLVKRDGLQRSAIAIDAARREKLKRLADSKAEFTSITDVAEAASLIDAFQSRRLNMSIAFKNGSAEFDVAALLQVQALGAALRSSQLRLHHFLILGYCDSVGSQAYNAVLSKRRADAVRDYLSNKMRVEPARLYALGMGEIEISDGDISGEAANRRVDIVTLAQ